VPKRKKVSGPGRWYNLKQCRPHTVYVALDINLRTPHRVVQRLNTFLNVFANGHHFVNPHVLGGNSR